MPNNNSIFDHNILENGFVLQDSTLRKWKLTRKKADHYKGRTLPGLFGTTEATIDMLMFLVVIILEIFGLVIVYKTVDEPEIFLPLFILGDFLGLIFVHSIRSLNILFSNLSAIGKSDDTINALKKKNKYWLKRSLHIIGLIFILASSFWKTFFVLKGAGIADYDPLLIKILSTIVYLLIAFIHINYSGYFFSYLWFTFFKWLDYLSFLNGEEKCKNVGDITTTKYLRTNTVLKEIIRDKYSLVEVRNLNINNNKIFVNEQEVGDLKANEEKWYSEKNLKIYSFSYNSILTDDIVREILKENDDVSPLGFLIPFLIEQQLLQSGEQIST